MTLAAARDFFRQRDILEVTTPALMAARLPEPQVKGFTTREENLYLQTSPDYGMKVLLAHGSGDIYQFSRVFRNDSPARIHNSEFTLVEWYRVGRSYQDLQQEALALINHLLETLSLPLLELKRIKYADLFLDLGLDPWQDQVDKLNHIATNQLQLHSEGLDREQLLDFIFSQHCIKQLEGENTLWAVEEFPINHASFAKRRSDRAQSCELYWRGVELANGCDEETNMEVLGHYFPSHAQLWEEIHGLPECAGIALGLDRLFMLLNGRDSLFSFPYGIDKRALK